MPKIKLSENTVQIIKDICAEFENKESVQIIYKCLDKLPNNYKTVIVLLKIEGEPQKKVAEIMNISEKAVESLFFRAKLKLKDLLENEKDI